MPLFPNASTYYKGRTHTQLVVSEGNAPAEKYIPSPAENYTKFIYEFGPEGNQEVVIPKGKVVALDKLEWDYETEHMVPAIKIANGLEGDDNFSGNKIIGVNHHNVYKRIRDRFSGNQPTIITREYIEVPLFGTKNAANDIKFGAAWAATPNALLGANVAVDEFGNFTVADATNYKSVIGKCLAIETDLPPAGYLQYFMEMEENEFTQFMRDMSYAPSPGRTKDSAWNDIGTYPEGTGYLKSRKDLIKTFNQGIPFLTDGYFRARTPKTYKLSDTGVVLRKANNVTITEKYDLDGEGAETDTDTVISVTVAQKEGAALFVRLPESIVKDNLQNNISATQYPEFANGPLTSNVVVKVNNVQYNDVHVDYTNNSVVLYFDSIATDITNATVTVDCVVLESQIPGIPTGWDFKGSVGAARILLK